jgi:hypothetical protein
MQAAGDCAPATSEGIAVQHYLTLSLKILTQPKPVVKTTRTRFCHQFCPISRHFARFPPPTATYTKGESGIEFIRIN